MKSNNHGGHRPGAGRKPGQSTRMNEQARAKALEGGVSPLAYMLTVLRDKEQSSDIRMDAAKAAAPYVHARLSSVEARHDLADPLGDLLRSLDGKTRGIPSEQ